MNEREYIADLAAGQAAAGLIRGIGDDCAVLDAGGGRAQLISMDTLVEGVHFDRAFHPPDLLGRKAVSVNVSDIAAMGGTPRHLLLSTAMPPGFDPDWARAFNRGFLAACRDYGCALIGGDTVAAPAFSFTVTVLGEMDADAVLYRSGARPGDTVFVSGDMGFAAAGLDLLQSGLAEKEADFAPFAAKHLNPEARVVLGRQLAAGGLVHALMDSSDGLATDLSHICAASRLGAQVFAENLPIPPPLRHAAALCAADPLDWVLRGGEDFELIFTAASENEARLRAIAQSCGLALHAVGRMDEAPGLRLATAEGREVALDFQGYEHFAENTPSRNEARKSP